MAPHPSQSAITLCDSTLHFAMYSSKRIRCKLPLPQNSSLFFPSVPKATFPKTGFGSTRLEIIPLHTQYISANCNYITQSPYTPNNANHRHWKCVYSYVHKAMRKLRKCRRDGERVRSEHALASVDRENSLGSRI